jgi:hypothetical protein
LSPSWYALRSRSVVNLVHNLDHQGQLVLIASLRSFCGTQLQDLKLLEMAELEEIEDREDRTMRYQAAPEEVHRGTPSCSEEMGTEGQLL